MTVVHSPPDGQPPPAPGIIPDFKTATFRLLERFAQDTSQSARIVHVLVETELDKVAVLADAIVSAVSAEHADNLVNAVSLSFRISSLIWFVCRRGMVGVPASATGEEEAFIRVNCLASGIQYDRWPRLLVTESFLPPFSAQERFGDPCFVSLVAPLSITSPSSHMCDNAAFHC